MQAKDLLCENPFADSFVRMFEAKLLWENNPSFEALMNLGMSQKPPSFKAPNDNVSPLLIQICIQLIYNRTLCGSLQTGAASTTAARKQNKACFWVCAKSKS